MIRVSWTTVIGASTLLIAAFLTYHTFDEAYAVSYITAGRGPVFFPRILLGVMSLFSIIVIIEGLREDSISINQRQFLVVIATFAVTGGYIFAITAAGFLISTIVFIFILPWLLGYRNFFVISALAATYPILIWYIFEKIFKVILPSSPWFDLF